MKFLIERGGAALFFDPGLGKTSTTLAALKILFKKKLVSKVLIIAPLRVCYSVWPKEVLTWKDFNKMSITVLHGPNKEELLRNSESDIYVINPEGLEWLLNVQKTKTRSGKTKVSIDSRRWKKLGFDCLVVDELSKFKHTNTNRFKALKQVLGTFKRKYGLTGSPAANGLMDLFGQCYIIDEGRSLGRYITHYRNEYYTKGYDGYSWELREGAEKEIYERIKPICLRMGDELLKDMPKIINNNIKVQMGKKLEGQYKALKKDLILKIGQGLVKASTAAVASNKLRQFCSGSIYKEQEVEALLKLPSNKKEWLKLHSLKIEALTDLVDELQGSPLLVAYDFKHELEMFKAVFGKDVPYLGGGVSTKKSKQIESDWNQGKLPILFGHPQSMAHGLNLQSVGNHVCWYTLSWNYELYDQLNRRVARQGNRSKRVFIHHILIEGTIDEVILRTLQSKKSTQQNVFQALKSMK